MTFVALKIKYYFRVTGSLKDKKREYTRILVANQNIHNILVMGKFGLKNKTPQYLKASLTPPESAIFSPCVWIPFIWGHIYILFQSS